MSILDPMACENVKVPVTNTISVTPQKLPN